MKKIISMILALIMVISAFPLNPIEALAENESHVLPKVCIGGSHIAAIKSDGSLWMWGANDLGQIGNGKGGSYTYDVKNPTKIMDNVSSVSLDSNIYAYNSAAIKTDGSLWMWGSNGLGQFGNGATDSSYVPVKIMDGVKKVSTYSGKTAIIKNDNSLWLCGGLQSYQKNGTGKTYAQPSPIKVMDNVLNVKIEESCIFVIKTDGSLWVGGYLPVYLGIDKSIKFGEGVQDYTSLTKVMDNVEDVYAHFWYITILKKDGSVWELGKTPYRTESDSIKEPIKVIDNVKAVRAGSYHTLVLRNDGSVWAWGEESNPNTGEGLNWEGHNFNYGYSPTKIIEDVKKISLTTSDLNGLIKTDDSLWTWGDNKVGEAGSNLTESAISNKLIKVLDEVDFFESKNRISAAITKNGELWMWGSHMISDGDQDNGRSYIPIKVMQLNAGLVISGENTVKNGNETVLKTIRYDENGNITPEGGITWSCSDESVAQISSWGNNVTVKGLKGGKATITAPHTESGQKADFEIEVVSYVMTLAGGYTVMLDEELEINYAVKQGEEYVHNDLDIKWEIESKDSNNAVKIISDKDNAYTRALTIKGINEGECELVAKVDGAELGRTKVEVLGNLADTINDETIIRAKYLVNNSQYKYYKNYNSVHGMFADEMDLTPSIVKYSLDNYLSVFYKSIYKGKAPDEVTATEFYECVLVKLLNDDENVKVFGKVGDVMSDYILKYGKKIAEKGTKIDDTNKKQLKEICEGLCGDGLEDVGFIDTLLISGKSIETYFEEYAKIYQMASCTNEQIKAIKLIKNSTSDKALKTACDNVIKSIEKAQADTAKYAVSSGTTKTAEQLSEYAFEKMVGALEKFSPALAAFDLVKEITSPINNILFQADDIESDTIDLYALIVIENALKDAISSAEKTFNSNPTAEKAENLMAVADFYKNVQLYGCDICDSLLENYGEAKRNQGIAWDTLVIIMKNVVKREVKMSDVFNALFGNVDAETLDNRKTLSDIRKLIDSADFYGSEGTDVAEFIREVKSTTPSEWAKSEIEKAKNYGFLPDYMQNNYQNNITRAEFCTILTWMIEEKTGKGIGQLIEEKGTPIKSPFEDTYYEYADYMCKLGIVNGVSATEFNPLGEITREQAATMLMRTADVLGYDTSYNTSVESGVSSWATEGVGFVTENGIMNGTGNGFEPQGKYTKEQAIATFVRMYDNLK